MKTLIKSALLLLLFVTLTVAANSYSSIESCDKDSSLDNLYMRALSDGRDLGNRMLAETVKMRKLIDDVDGKKGEPMVNSMNKEQVAEFAKIQARMWTFTMEELIISRRKRDVLVILELIKRDENSYQGIEQEKADPKKFKKLIEKKYYEDLVQGKNEIPYAEIRGFISFGLSEFEDDLIGNIKYEDDKCSEIALLMDKQNTVAGRLDDINQNTVNKYKEFKQKLTNKYKGEKLSLDILSEDEKSLNAHYKKVVITPTNEIVTMVKRYELAKTLIFMNNKIYESDMKDVYLYAGENSKLGTTLSKLVEAGEFEKIELQVIYLWRSMNGLIPPDSIIDLAKTSKLIESLK